MADTLSLLSELAVASSLEYGSKALAITTKTSNPVCSNCSTTETPLWRRDQNGNHQCNACGLYQKQYNKPRPYSLKSTGIKKRFRKSPFNKRREEKSVVSNKELSSYNSVAQRNDHYSMPSPPGSDYSGNERTALISFHDFLRKYDY